MKTKSYTKLIGIVLAVVSVFTLLFNWVSAAKYVKSITKAASGLLSMFGMDENAGNIIGSAIEEAMGSLSDEMYRSADSTGIYQDDLKVVSNSTKKIISSVKDLALSPRDVSVISSSLGKAIKVAEKYTGSSGTNSLGVPTEVKTLLTVVSIFISLVTLLGLIVIVTRVLGKSKGWDIAFFISMILLAASFILATAAINKELMGQTFDYYLTIDSKVLRLTLWPFIGVLCAFPIGLLPNIKHAAAPALVCANCGGKVDASERFCSHCGAPVSQVRQASAAAVCPTCGASVGDGYAFCPSCGSPVEQHTASGWVCPDCGVTLDGSTRFCPTCGHPKI